jgi:Phage integrase, N-terminal SAM-like domain
MNAELDALMGLLAGPIGDQLKVATRATAARPGDPRVGFLEGQPNQLQKLPGRGQGHGGEFVVNAAATARYRPLLEAINRAVPPPAGVRPERPGKGRAYFGGGESGVGVGEGGDDSGVGSVGAVGSESGVGVGDLVGQFCNFQRKQRGKTEGGVRTYRWNLEQFLVFVRNRDGRLARVTDLTASTLQAWMDDMAAENLALSTMRVRQSTVSSFCAWLVKREMLTANPVAKLERPPHHREPPSQVPGSSIMDALVEAAKQRRRPRDVAIFLILRYTGHAARIRGDSARRSPRRRVGLARRSREGRQDAGHSTARGGDAVYERVRRALPGPARREDRPGHAAVLVELGQARRR